MDFVTSQREAGNEATAWRVVRWRGYIFPAASLPVDWSDVLRFATAKAPSVWTAVRAADRCRRRVRRRTVPGLRCATNVDARGDVAEHSPSFGAELRRCRQAAGLKLDQLAKLVNYSVSHLSNIETGRKTASVALARKCDQVLDADGTLVALIGEANPRDPAITRFDEKLADEMFSEWPGAETTPFLRLVDRRQAIAAGGLLALGAFADASPSPVRVHSILAASRHLFHTFRQLGQATGAETILPPLIAQTKVLHALTKYAGTAAAMCFDLTARYAEYAGWMFQEAGHDHAALWWTDRAVECAIAGGDQDLAAYALVRRALLALYRDDAAETIALSRRGQVEGVPHRIFGLALQREAQGYALAGEERACLRALEKARPLLDSAPTPAGSTLGPTHLPDPVMMITGWCLRDLGRFGEAANVMGEAISRLPPSAERTRTRYGIRRALALAEDGQLDEACALTGELLPSYDVVGSATIAVDLRRLRRSLARHRDAPVVRELSPRLTTALR